jgi:hypothetical protein
MEIKNAACFQQLNISLHSIDSPIVCFIGKGCASLGRNVRIGSKPECTKPNMQRYSFVRMIKEYNFFLVLIRLTFVITDYMKAKAM